MDLKISERCCGGDCFAPFCTMDAYQNQQQDAQAIPPSYPTCTCVPLFNTIVSDQSYLTSQAAHTTQDTSYTSDYRVRFPAIEAPQWCEVSRHNAVEECLLSSFQPTSGKISFYFTTYHYFIAEVIVRQFRYFYSF